MTRAPKIAAQKKQPISILRDKKYLYQTALMLLNPDIVHKMMQKLYKLEYGFLKIRKNKVFSLPTCLTTFASLEAK